MPRRSSPMPTSARACRAPYRAQPWISTWRRQLVSGHTSRTNKLWRKTLPMGTLARTLLRTQTQAQPRRRNPPTALKKPVATQPVAGKLSSLMTHGTSPSTSHPHGTPLSTPLSEPASSSLLPKSVYLSVISPYSLPVAPTKAPTSPASLPPSTEATEA